MDVSINTEMKLAEKIMTVIAAVSGIALAGAVLFMLTGCGGSPKNPAPPAIAQASGVWQTVFTPNLPGNPASVTLNMSQGQSSTNADGMPVAPLSVAAVFNIPACPGLQGVSTSGNVTGHAVTATLKLSDGEIVTIGAGVNNDAPAAILFNGRYTVTAGPASCFGSAGTITGHQ